MTIGQMLFSGNGRIRRRDYWLWSIGVYAGFFVLLLVVSAVSNMTTPAGVDPKSRELPFPAMAALIIGFGLFVGMNACITVKRWHDRNRSGLMYFIRIIPVLGLAWTLIECGFLDGTPGRNKYGRSPKGIGNEPATF